MDGFINLDKESGLSSHQAVAAVRRLLHCKAGHAGTLDPLATGVLPVCLGSATRLSEYVMGQEKVYLTRVRLGIATDSCDAAGAVLDQKDASWVRREDIEALLPRFRGRVMQRPPLISAIKQGGQPLYKRVRRGEDVEVEERPVEIYSLEIVGCSLGGPEPWLDLRVACGQGTYIRSLASDLGELLQTGAHVAALRRLAVGAFKVEDAYTLAQIEQLVAEEDRGFVLPCSVGVARFPRFVAPPQALTSLRHGNDWRVAEAERDALSACPVLRVETADGSLLGIGNIGDNGLLRLHKVFAPNYNVVAIGNFDGMHTGHQQLMQAMRRLKNGGQSAVLTFNPHPQQLITGQTPPLLNTAAEKRRLVLGSGVEAMIELPFDERLMLSSPAAFVDEVIVGRAAARQVVVGFNFRFGARGAGDAALLRELCAARGIGVEIVTEVSGPYGAVSSSNIRRYLQQGDMAAVNHMLGYWYELSGTVIMGNQLGRRLGFPTANFVPPRDKALPPRGVYAVRVLWRGKSFDGVANIGYKPTVSGGAQQMLVEAHLFDAAPQLYGEHITVRLGAFLRGEQHFAGVDELAARIVADSQAARQFLTKN